MRKFMLPWQVLGGNRGLCVGHISPKAHVGEMIGQLHFEK
jgi:dihydroxyacid dehydratase/phosphogluconate dehydratase